MRYISRNVHLKPSISNHPQMSVESDLKKWRSMGFLLTRFPRMNLDTIWICQKNRFGTIHLKSVLINFLYCCKYSVERGFLERLIHKQGWGGDHHFVKRMISGRMSWKRICIKFLFMFCMTSKSFSEVVVVNWATHAPDMINPLDLKDMVAFTLSQPSHRIVSRFCSMQQHVQRIKKQEPLEASGRASNFRLER